MAFRLCCMLFKKKVLPICLHLYGTFHNGICLYQFILNALYIPSTVSMSASLELKK